jgi:hypothetical protein
MKNLLILAFIAFSINSSAQTPVAMPADAYTFYNNAMPVLRQQIKTIVIHTANALKNRRPNSDSLKKRLNENPALNKMSNNEIDGITLLIMVQVSKNVDSDLKQMVLSMNKSNESTEEIKQIKLQLIMDRKSDISQETNNVMKKFSASEESIINSLK